MSSVGDVKSVLRNAKSIKDIETEQFDVSKIFVTPDLTKCKENRTMRTVKNLNVVESITETG